MISNEELKRIELAPFMFLNAHVNNYNLVVNKILDTNNKNTDAPELLHDLYFSDANIEIIQRQLILQVFKKTNKEFLINKQDPQQLKIVMQYMYKEYGRYLSTDITKQISELNKRVVDELAPRVTSEASQYAVYIKDINQRIIPLDRPVNVASRGTKTLPSVTTRY
ncbi:MAG: hypothetical protein Faunusvirus8_2 [Faunusvirus sp.]|jgi:hypothetical protein|uniref:Minor capsid protein P8 central region domain-containing protein n=1 Tax=Faunusvirus sp. TaxID=2487766 RepID=A0A3G4ZWM5_9VIRU|nr:MAG: hypothetical protein Faunusvirus8_2 [Faunusvirus sp.]